MKNDVPTLELAISKRGFVCPAVACTASFAYGDVVPTPTLPLEFQIPDPAKYALPETENAVVDAFVTVSLARDESKAKALESVNAPAVVINGTRPLVRDETVRLVVEAVPK